MQERNLECDATPSWSGYNYQGKIALYIVLTKICELYKAGKINEIDNYRLELEWLEDFSIIYNANDKNTYKTIHQVKALDTTDINDYGEAIFGLAAKVIEFNTIENAYLHTWKSINLNSLNWKETIKELAKKNREETKIIKEMEKLLIDGNIEFNNIFSRILKPKSGPAPNIIKRIQLNISKEIEDVKEDDVKEAIRQALNYAKLDNTQFASKLSDQCLNKIEIYNYDGKNNCDLEEVKEKILVRINENLELQGSDWRVSDSNYKETIYYYLMGIIDNNIINRHKSYSLKNKVTISFKDFNSILINQRLSDKSKEYYLYYLKNKLFEMHSNYCKACGKKNYNNDICFKCKLSDVIEYISKMNMDVFEKFCRIICPDVKGEINRMEVVMYMLETTGINTSFFKTFSTIEKEFETKQEMIRYTTTDNKTLLVTSLSEKGLDSSFVCTNIVENKEIDGAFMDIDELISKDIDEESIWESANRINTIDVSEYDENSEVEVSDHICHCKKVSIKKVEDIIRRFNK